MSDDCFSCGTKFNDPKDIIMCIQCKNYFHSGCTSIKKIDNLRRLGQKREQWKCDSCKSTKQLPSDELANNIFEKFKIELESATNRTTKELKDLQISVQFISDKFDQYTVKINEMLTEINKLKVENDTLKKENENLKEQNQMIQTEARNQNIIISGIKQTKNENMQAIIQSVARAINFELDEKEINSAYRQSNGGQQPSNRIIVRFTRKITRDQMIAAYKLTCKTSNTFGIETKHISKDLDQGRVFVGEHLTPQTASLLKAAKEELKRKNYKFIWVKDNKIYAKQTDNEKIVNIRSETDIVKLIQ